MDKTNIYLKALQECIESEFHPHTYLTAVENDGLMNYLYDHVKTINSPLDLTWANYYHMQMYLTLWEKIAIHSDQETRRFVNDNLDDIWNAITVASNMLKWDEYEYIHQVELRVDMPDITIIKDIDDLRELKVIAEDIVRGIFEAYLSNERLQEAWLDDLIKWYLRDDSEYVNKTIKDTYIDGWNTLYEDMRGIWVTIIREYISDEDNRIYIKKKIEDMLDNDNLKGEENAALKYILNFCSPFFV